MSFIRRLPWKLFRRTALLIRMMVFGVARPDQDILVVDAPVEELKATFRTHHFTSGWLFSYYYYGEDANLRRPEPGNNPDRWYQLHVRIFERDDGGCELHCHYEFDPLLHPKRHLLGKVVRVKYGLVLTQTLLTNAGYVVRRTTPNTSNAD